jgi:hypothetical protein
MDFHNAKGEPLNHVFTLYYVILIYDWRIDLYKFVNKVSMFQ